MVMQTHEDLFLPVGKSYVQIVEPPQSNRSLGMGNTKTAHLFLQQVRLSHYDHTRKVFYFQMFLRLYFDKLAPGILIPVVFHADVSVLEKQFPFENAHPHAWKKRLRHLGNHGGNGWGSVSTSLLTHDKLHLAQGRC